MTANKSSDATGIVVISKTADKEFVIEEEKTGIYTPQEWGLIVKRLYEKYEANAVIYETNQGGDLVKENIQHSLGYTLNCVGVHSTKGKILRAEPIATLYAERPRLSSSAFSNTGKGDAYVYRRPEREITKLFRCCCSWPYLLQH